LIFPSCLRISRTRRALIHFNFKVTFEKWK